ncbi:hypothetical protein J6590_095413 [Homalodisca vitripennis]|nr:hypothetical protein J6590_095413 [Homalodisca vitripennis]
MVTAETTVGVRSCLVMSWFMILQCMSRVPVKEICQMSPYGQTFMLKYTLFYHLEVSIKCISCYVSTFHSFIVSKSKRSRKARAVADIKVYPGEMTCQKRSRDSDGVRGQREKDSQEVTRDSDGW